MSDLEALTDHELRLIAEDRFNAARDAIGTPDFDYAFERALQISPEWQRREAELRRQS